MKVNLSIVVGGDGGRGGDGHLGVPRGKTHGIGCWRLLLDPAFGLSATKCDDTFSSDFS